MGPMPGGDLVSPPQQRASEGAGFDGIVLVLQVRAQLSHPLEGEVGIAVGIELADGLLSAFHTVATSPFGSPARSRPMSLSRPLSSSRSSALVSSLRHR